MKLEHELISELNKAMQLASEMGFLVGFSFGIFIGWILHSCLKQYYKAQAEQAECLRTDVI